MKQVYTLDDLLSRDVLDAGAGKPARFAVIGMPIAHSASPGMHQAALDELGIDARYIRLEVPAGMVKEAFARMRELGFRGCNVTVPHKIEAMAACDEVHPSAVALGAINTVCFDTDATRGHNTDGPGFANAIEEAFGVPLGSLKVAVVGAGGGAGQAIAMQCGLSGCTDVVLINRTVDKLAPLKKRIAEHAPDTHVRALALTDSTLSEACHGCDLIVNATSVGLKPDDSSPIGEDCFRAEQFVYDAIYKPTVTPMMSAAEKHGAKTTNGKSMLLHQGALAFQLWNGGSSPLAAMRRGLG